MFRECPCLHASQAPCATTNAFMSGRTLSGGAKDFARAQEDKIQDEDALYRSPLTAAQGLCSLVPRGQNSSFRAFAGNALTTVFAGFAFTMTVLPKISLFPAFVAAFLRVFSMTRPGITNFAFFFTSEVPMLASVSSIFFASAFLISHASAMLPVNAPLDMTVALGAMAGFRGKLCGRESQQRGVTTRKRLEPC